MLKLSTINQMVEAIIAETPGSKQTKEMRANEAVIVLKTALICEHDGIDKAMGYYFGTHDTEEFQEFRTFVTAERPVEYRIHWKAKDGSRGVTWAGSQSDALRIKKRLEHDGKEVDISRETI